MRSALTKQAITEDLAAFYTRVRSQTEKLCEPLEIEDYIPQPVVDVSPPKWNIAHTTWFFEEMILKRFVPDYRVFDEQFGFLFNSYYNSIGDRTERDHREDFSSVDKKEAANAEFVKIDAGNYEIGFAGDGFCFDNELARHRVFLDIF